MAAVRNIIVRVGADASTLQKTLQKSQTDIKKFGGVIKEMGGPMQGLKGEFDKMVRTFPALGPLAKTFGNIETSANGVLGPIKMISPATLAIGAAAAAAAIGIGVLIKGATDLAQAFWDVGMKYDTAFNKIQFKTAETGTRLAGLKQSFKNIYTSTAGSTEDITNAMVAVNQRLGLTGKAFDDLVKSEMRYAKVSDTDVGQTVLTTTRLFGDWSIKAKNYTKALDMMYVATARTGVPTERLNELMVKFGGPMRQLGFSFESAAALLGKFEKEGVNTELVMGAMRRGLGKWSKAGMDVDTALSKMIEKIKSAGSAGKANALAIETFGIKAGPDMAAAIREGRFNIAELTNTLKTNKLTLAGAASETATFAGKMEIAKRRVEGILEPIGVKLVDALQAKLFPVIKDVTDAIVSGLDPAMAYLSGSTKSSELKIKGHTKAIQEEYPWLKDTKVVLDDLNKAFNSIDTKKLISDAAQVTAAMISITNKVPKAVSTIGTISKAAGKTGGKLIEYNIATKPLEIQIATVKKIASTDFPAAGQKIKSTAGSVGGFFQKLGTDIGNTFNNIVKSVQTWGINLGADIANTFNKAVSRVKTWGTDMMSAIGGFFQKVGASIVQVFGKVVTFFKELPGKVGTFLIDLFVNKIPEWIGIGLGAMVSITVRYFTNMFNFYTSLPGRIAKIFTDVVAAVSTWGVNMYNTVVIEVPKIVNGIVNFFVSLPGKIQSFMDRVKTTIIMWGINVGIVVATEVPKIVNKIINFFMLLPARISSIFWGMLTKITSWGINAYIAVTVAVPKIVNAVINFFKSLPGKIAKFFSDIISNIFGWGNKGAAQAGTASTKIAKGITAPIESLPAKMVKFGKNIIDGLIKGIKDFGGGAVKTVKSMADNFSKGFRKGMEIGSPSRVFFRYGQFITQGLIKGIKNDKEGVKQTLADIVNTFMQSAEKLRDFGGLFGKVQMEKFKPQDFIRGMKSQINVMNSWKKSVQTLGTRLGAKSPLFQELLKLGPESAGELKALAGSSNAEMKQITALYKQKSNLALAWGGVMAKGEVYSQKAQAGITVQITGNTIASDYDTDKLMNRVVTKLRQVGAY